ncbi:MAG: response regulator [Gammaproteobacteria bacterium]|nr:response regulator [Gammaproteobacteria bacterium]
MSHEAKVNILVADDSITVRRTIIKSLGDEHVIHEATDGEQAWKLLESTKAISLVFADIHMPTMNGLTLLKKIRDSELERIASLPVIIITGYENADAAKRACHLIGATDFIGKPFDSYTILSKVGLYTKLDKSIVETKQNVTYDKLTGLFNESSFTEYCLHALENEYSTNSDTSLLCLQVIGLSDVLRDHGETTSEQIIIAIANHLNQTLQDDGMVAHFGSGKFSIVLPATTEFKANIIGIRLQNKVSNLKFETSDAGIRVKMAMGISTTNNNQGPQTFDELHLRAEQALQMSIEQSAAPIVRYDETYEKRYSDEQHANKKELKKSNRQMVPSDDAIKMKKYFTSIMSGDFDRVPAYYVEAMIAPLQNFLEYAYDNTEVEMKKPAGSTERTGY